MIAERALTGDERAEIREAAAAVDLPDLDALDEVIASVLNGETTIDDDLVFHLGAWWGERVRQATGWKWVYLTFGEGLEAPGLVSDDRGVAVLPLQLVGGVLDGTHDDVLRVILERLRSGARPQGEPGSYAIVG